MEAMYAAGVSIFSLVAFIAILAIDVYMAGDTPKVIGGLSILFFIAALCAFAFNISQMTKQTELKDRIICMIISTVCFAVWLVTFLIGMFN